MNRAMRRATGSRLKEPVYTLTQSQIQMMKKDATDKAIDTAFVLMLGLPAMVIEGHYPQLMKKEDRVQTFIDLVLEQYDCFNQGYVTLDEIHAYLQDNFGIKIEKGKVK